MGFLIDGHGRIVERTHTRLSTCDETALLVRSGGYIWVEEMRHACSVWLSIPMVSPPAEAALCFLLSDIGSRRVVVSFLSEADTCRIFSSVAAAIRAVTDELASHRRAHATRFASRRLDMRDATRSIPLRLLLDAFPASAGPTDITGLESLLIRALRNRFLIVKQTERAERLIVRAVGLGYSGFDVNWAESAAGQSLEEQPDIDYGIWLSQGYLFALESGEPVADEVDAAIFRPSYGRRRFAYRRLLLPFVSSDGDPCLLSTSIPDTSIELGVN